MTMSEPVSADDDIAEPEPQGCLATLLRLFGIRLQPTKEPRGDDALPYRLTQRFLSPSELSFYKALLQVLPDEIVVSVKPRLGDILFVPRGSACRWALQNKIQSKHVDFLLCSKQTMAPLVAIELDDKSHARADRIERDEFVDQAFAAAGLDVIHVKARASYVLEDIRALLKAVLEKKGSASVTNGSKGEHPICPNCRTPMVQRTASKGSQKGNIFWGCENYPNCREALPVR